MAIKYAGSRNLIGYGQAQVFKQQDVTKGIEGERARKAAAAAAKKKAKIDAQKNLTELLKDVDYSKVRTADISHFQSEFDDILAKANAITTAGGNPLTDLDLRKQINQFRANSIASSNGKDDYNRKIKEATQNEDYQTESNAFALERENKAPMFGPNASYFATDDDFGNVATIEPTLDVEDHYKKNIENLALKDVVIEEVPGGGFKYKASNGSYRTFTTRQELEEDQLTDAANNILENHPYKYSFRTNQEAAAEKAGFGTDVLAYIKDQIRQRTGETDVKGFVDKEVKGINVSLSQGTPESPGSGRQFDVATTQFTNISRFNPDTKTAVAVNRDFNFTTRNIPAVTKTNKEGEIEIITPEKFGTTFDYGPESSFNVRPTADRGFMIFSRAKDATGAEIGLEMGYNTRGENVDFVPSALVFNPTAKKDIVVEIDGNKEKIRKGEMIDDEALQYIYDNNLNNQDSADFDRDNQFFSIEPWLEGKEKRSGITVNVGFDDAVHDRFAAFITAKSGKADVRKRRIQTYYDMMKRAGITPKDIELNRKQ